MSDYNPLVSIVIPAYNASNYLAEAIDSALAQTYKNVEIIVVNDGSKDDGATEKVALSYGDKIKYIHKENGGSSSALNTGIKNMSGEWFSWLSHDDLYYENKLEAQFDYIAKSGISLEDIHNNVFFSASELINADGAVINSPKNKEIMALHEEISHLKNNKCLIAEPTKYIFHGCSCLVHRSVFDRVGLFDENLRLLNDIDMWYRIYSGGFNINYIPRVLIKGRVHSKQVSKSIGYSYHNPEQDMYWKRSFEWLKANCSDDYDLFFRYGRNAFLKTRTVNGNEAFDYANKLKPDRRFILFIKGFGYKLRASLKNLAKKLYILIRV